MSRTGQFIYLRTRGYLDIDRGTNQVRSFVCHNALVDEEEGKKLVKEMKKKFAIMIQETEFSQDDGDVPAVENPAQLERAIVSMITNLHQTQAIEEDVVQSPPTRQGSMDGHESDTSRSAKSPPLAIIAPKVSTIKTSLTRSVDVISTAAKGMRNYCSSVSGDDDYDDDNEQHEHTQCLKPDHTEKTNVSRPSVLQKAVGPNNASFTSGPLPIDRKQSSHTSCNTDFNEQISTTTTVIDQTIQIKEENPSVYGEQCVSTLPTSSSSYFDASSYNPSDSFSENVPSPLECKPFVMDQHNYSQQISSSQYLAGNNSAQYQQYETNNISSLSPNYIDSSSIVLSNLKRTHSIEDINNATKRRYCGDNTMVNDVNKTADSMYVKNANYSIQQQCIDQLTDANLGKFFFCRI